MQCLRCLATMVPDLLSCGRSWLTCPNGHGSWIPGGTPRHECENCGRRGTRRCKWSRYGDPTCKHWEPTADVRKFVQMMLFEDPKESE